MLAAQFLEAAGAARNSAALDETARLLWRAHSEGHIADADAEAISEALQARRAALAAPRRVSQPKAILGHPRPATRQRSPDRQASIERRRRQAASGVVPSKIASSFTLGETAALTVIARQCQRGGVCSLPIDMIAALAGVSRSTTQNALRAARRLGLLEVKERRRRGLPSLTNVIRVIAAEWLNWLKVGAHGGGCRKSSPTYSHFSLRDGKAGTTAETVVRSWRDKARSAIVPTNQERREVS